MKHQPLDQLKHAWAFRHASLPVSEQDLDQIKLMTKQRANTLWDSNISRTIDHPDFFTKNDWPGAPSTWQVRGFWEAEWEEDAPTLPQEVIDFLPWEVNTPVYYCLSRNVVLETNWDVFSRCWKNFLFMSDGALLLGKKRNEVVQFLSDGWYKLGYREQ